MSWNLNDFWRIDYWDVSMIKESFSNWSFTKEDLVNIYRNFTHTICWYTDGLIFKDWRTAALEAMFSLKGLFQTAIAGCQKAWVYSLSPDWHEFVRIRFSWTQGPRTVASTASEDGAITGGSFEDSFVLSHWQELTNASIWVDRCCMTKNSWMPSWISIRYKSDMNPLSS